MERKASAWARARRALTETPLARHSASTDLNGPRARTAASMARPSVSPRPLVRRMPRRRAGEEEGTEAQRHKGTEGREAQSLARLGYSSLRQGESALHISQLRCASSPLCLCAFVPLCLPSGCLPSSNEQSHPLSFT